MQSLRVQSWCIMGDVQMANIDNHKLKTLRTECSRKKVQACDQLPQSSHFQFLSTKPFTAVGEIIENLQKLTVMWSLNVRFLVDNTDISEIV